MTSGIIDTKNARATDGYNSAASAVEYLLSRRDSSGKERDPQPVVLEGNAKLFIASARLCIGGPSYLSLYFSDRCEPATAPLRSALRYLIDLQKAHLCAGVEGARCAFFSALHLKHNAAWDLHLLASLSDLKTGKKLRLQRPGADFERFTKLRALFNTTFGLPEPCLPENVQPLRIRRTFQRWQAPVRLDATVRRLNDDLKGARIPDRDALVRLLGDLGEVEPRRNSIALGCDGERWMLEGYPASEAFDSPGKLEKHLRNTCRFAAEVGKDPKAQEDRVIGLYGKAVEENSRRFGLTQKRRIYRGQLVPDMDFFKAYYLRDGRRTYAKTYAKNGRDKPEEPSTAIPSRSGYDRSGGRTQPPDSEHVGHRAPDRQPSFRAPAGYPGIATPALRGNRRETQEPPLGNPQVDRSYREELVRWLRLIFGRALEIGRGKKKKKPSKPPTHAEAEPSL